MCDNMKYGYAGNTKIFDLMEVASSWFASLIETTIQSYMKNDYIYIFQYFYNAIFKPTSKTWTPNLVTVLGIEYNIDPSWKKEDDIIPLILMKKNCSAAFYLLNKVCNSI
jgi:hypothetical protein